MATLSKKAQTNLQYIADAVGAGYSHPDLLSQLQTEEQMHEEAGRVWEWYNAGMDEEQDAE